MLTAILSAVIGGVILNFMPCVLPVLALKVFGLARHGAAPRQAKIDAVAYASGAIASFVALGALIAAIRTAGVAVGWGFQLQSPVVTGGLALLMLAAALNLFGVFEVGTSAQGVGQGLAGRRDWIGAALTGVLAVVVATPCAAPFMVGALAYALVQPAARSLAVFLALGVGFVAPFLILAFVPGLAARMPRPGPWMAVLKRGLGVPMLGSAAWLAWVVHGQTGDRGLAWLLVASILGGLGALSYGLAQRRRMRGAPYRSLHALAIAGAALAVGIVPALAEAPVAAPAAIPAPLPSGRVVSADPQAWSPDRVAALRAQGKPVFVNFTASWCVTCQANKAALSAPEVKAALRRTGATYLVADSTRFDARIESAMTNLGAGGLPLYVVYPAGGGAPRILPQVLTRGIVVQALEKARSGAT